MPDTVTEVEMQYTVVVHFAPPTGKPYATSTAFPDAKSASDFAEKEKSEPNFVSVDIVNSDTGEPTTKPAPAKGSVAPPQPQPSKS